MSRAPSIVGVCGNPAPESKTLTLTTEVVAEIAARLPGSTTEVVDLSSYGGKVLAWGDPDTEAARATVRAADLVVVATPVYKGAYTGLLKGFLDGYGAGELRPCLAVPLTIAASPAHALAGPTHLEPVLREVGCLTPAGTLHVPDQVAADPEARSARVRSWLDDHWSLLGTIAQVGA
ncbi:NADPH-dependent FMN reductase [Nocardioides daeguensis]|uniref:NAD(P)H-dependent oxidoreductase n=1 Tax=Nocardioides daeguensis TaxID=908359 RepID=A0ABP6WA61_9ACTN|nr:NAD(P)H-dependent oxidoreductase [Nocardioides daeguensis]MBV6729358.1 NAD(P)H-dependent oxidoreductase [Nocardioides daeguensis]MCR1774334.1 NAD(P)H-dependent oxidoreductase [Nocardioides daeguensis]